MFEKVTDAGSHKKKKRKKSSKLTSKEKAMKIKGNIKIQLSYTNSKGIYQILWSEAEAAAKLWGRVGPLA